MTRLTTANGMLAKAMSEQQLQDAIVDCAHAHGWMAFHCRPAQTSQGWRTAVEYDGKDFPDLVLARCGEVLFWECKREGQKLRPEQEVWLRATGGNVVYPHDWLSGKVEEKLK